MIRRSFVLSAAAMTLALAGCKGSDKSPTPTPTPTPTPSPTPTPTYSAFPLTANAEFGTIDAFTSYTGDLSAGTAVLGVAGTEGGSTRLSLAALADPTAASTATGGTPEVVRENTEEGRFDKADLIVAPAAGVTEYVFNNTTITKSSTATTVLASRAEYLNNTVKDKVTSDAGLALTRVSYTGWTRDDSAAGSHRITYGVWGYPTFATDFPTTGTATYTARIAGRAVSATAGTGSVVKLGGTVTVTINFSTSAVTYTANITKTVGGVVSAYATFTGTGAIPAGSTQFSGTFGAGTNFGTFNGALFGPAGAEIGIAFAGSGMMGGADTRLAGVIVGKK